KYANEPDFIRNFEIEAKTVARLENPFIVPLYDYWRDPNGAYLVMRYLRGGTLKPLLEAGPMDLAQVATILDNICDALWTAHQSRVAHRDIKPANILLDDEGRAYLSDFGLAITINEDHFKEAGGTWLYMSPERLEFKPEDHRVDVYSLGIVAYQMVTGEYPFPTGSLRALIKAHTERELPPIEETGVDAPIALNTVLRRATAKAIADRYDDIREFAQDFRTAIQAERSTVSARPITSNIANPYLGLRPFSEADHLSFFGRQRLVDALVERMDEDHQYRNFLGVVGPSGSGKSSLVYAGLIPQLREGALEGAADWFYASMTPGSDPFKSIAQALERIAAVPVDDVTQQLATGGTPLDELLRELIGNTGQTLMLFIDQFEEVFTLVKNEAVRQQFLTMLVNAIESDAFQLRVIVTLRADFYDRPLWYEDFGKMLRERTEIVLPMDTSELERAIVGPVRRLGMHVEPELVAEMIADVRSEPGTLPLLQYSLRELFDQREGMGLTHRAYQKMGGLRGTLARRANEVHHSLSTAQQVLARQAFLRLVALGEGTEDTRRRAKISELRSLSDDTVGIMEVLNTFTTQRLLTFDNDPETREPTVEVAHEALIREWDLFRVWLDESRDDLRLLRQLTEAAAAWREQNADPSYLLRGNRLAQFEGWATRTTVAVGTDERQFLDQSIEQREREQQAEEARQEKEIALAKQASTRLRQILVVIVIALIAVTGLSVTVLNRNDLLASERDAAYSSAFAATAQQAFEDGNHQLALSFALAALDTNPDSLVSQATMDEIAYGTGIRQVIDTGNRLPVYDLALSDDGSLIAGVQGRTYLDFYKSLLSPEDQQAAENEIYVPDPDFSQIDFTNAPERLIRLWDTETGELSYTFDAHAGAITALGFMPTGDGDPPTQMYSASILGEVFIWDIESGAIIHEIALPQGYNQLHIAASGEEMMASTGSLGESENNQIVVLEIATGEVLSSFEPYAERLWDAVYSEEYEYAIAIYRDVQVLWDMNTEEVLFTSLVDELVTYPYYQLTMEVNGKYSSTNLGSSEVYIWEVEFDDDGTIEIELEELSFNLGSVFDIGLSTKGNRLVLLQPGGEFVDWSVEFEAFNEIVRERGASLRSVALNFDGEIGVIGREDGTIAVWDLRNRNPDTLQVFTQFDSDMRAAFLPIGPDETTGEVHDRMMLLGAEAVLKTVQKIE
ncbi:MAG: protein kinase, partial [Chloroflexota bacterium]